MLLTKVERLILANQFRILELLDPENAEGYSIKQKILHEGFMLEYDNLLLGYDEVPEEVCREVTDILDMFRALFCAIKLHPKAAINKKHAKFQGFDGNNEELHLAYARFLIEDLNHWEESKLPDLNSHRQVLGRYRAMLRHWMETPERFELTPEDVNRITAVWSKPAANLSRPRRNPANKPRLM